jgi:hypothetical protein
MSFTNPLGIAMAFSFRPAFSFGFSHRHAFRIQIPWRLTDRQLLESSSNEPLTLGMRHVYECRMDFFIQATIVVVVVAALALVVIIF